MPWPQDLPPPAMVLLCRSLPSLHHLLLLSSPPSDADLCCMFPPLIRRRLGVPLLLQPQLPVARAVQQLRQGQARERARRCGRCARCPAFGWPHLRRLAGLLSTEGCLRFQLGHCSNFTCACLHTSACRTHMYPCPPSLLQTPPAMAAATAAVMAAAPTPACSLARPSSLATGSAAPAATSSELGLGLWLCMHARLHALLPACAAAQG